MYELHSVDSRPTHPLAPLASLEEVRAARKSRNEEAVASTSCKALPKLRPGRSFDDEDDQGSLGAAAWNPVSAARAQLQAERPETFERMQKTINHCKIARGNRKYRLDTLGVFDSDVNEVRARTMFRVQMHQELSPVYMRLPQTLKDIKPAVVETNINTRLDQMYSRVLHSLDEPKAPAAGAVSGRRGERAQLRKQASSARTRTANGAGGPGPASRQGSVTRDHERAVSAGVSTDHRAALFAGNGGGSMAALRSAEWKKAAAAALPPEVAEARLQQLVATTEEHLGKYHAAVAAAQHGLLLREGLEPGLMDRTPEEVEAELTGRLAEEAKQQEQLDEASLKEVSRRLRHAGNTAGLISAALEHVGVMAEDLAELKKSLPEEKVVERKQSIRRRRASVRHGTTGAGGLVLSRQGSSKRTIGEGGEASVTFGDLGDDATASGLGEDDEYMAKTLSRSLSQMSTRSSRSQSRIDGTAAAAAAASLAAAAAVAAAAAAAPPPPVPGPLISNDRIQEMRARLEAIASSIPRKTTKPSASSPTSAALPPLPPAPTPSLAMQARLERLWNALLVPTVQRLDMVLRFTRRDRVLQFEQSVDVWEAAAAVVLHREALLADLVSMQEGLERNTVASVSIPIVERLCCSIVQATYEAKALGTALDEEYGSVLEYKGRPYPGEGDQVVGVSHLVRVLEYMQKYDGSVKLLL